METKTEVNVGKLLKVAKLIAEILGLVLSMLKRSGYDEEAKETVQNIVRVYDGHSYRPLTTGERKLLRLN